MDEPRPDESGTLAIHIQPSQTGRLLYRRACEHVESSCGPPGRSVTRRAGGHLGAFLCSGSPRFMEAPALCMVYTKFLTVYGCMRYVINLGQFSPVSLQATAAGEDSTCSRSLLRCESVFMQPARGICNQRSLSRALTQHRTLGQASATNHSGRDPSDRPNTRKRCPDLQYL